ncbi:hypothetical protein CBR_g11121 [Chara braunii]|uniref:Uncharacterized protein n=1 Tax=Chara braunii TaxID=69332 RepID=A0A388KQB0_CHABU|nr:hypothetical protein CBR_g11121 [Chara braunii]|eukprot:GBG72188.1 hypothetical protein CBR_g11121 [Chara braunii]
MEWLTCRLLDVSPSVGSGGAKICGGLQQAQCAAFHPTEALVAVAVGRVILEFDVLVGSKLACMDMGGTVMKMAYCPSGGHTIVAVLEDDMTIRAWDIDAENTSILYSPDGKKVDKPVTVHIALTPLRPWLFFAAHKRTTVNVVGTAEGVKPAQKLKLDIQKHVSFLACHPREPLLYVAYMDGSIRGYNLNGGFQHQYTLGPSEGMLKLGGAEAIAFHATADVMFVGDRANLLLAYDLRTRVCLGSISIDESFPTSVAWHPTIRCVVILRKDGITEGYTVRLPLGMGGGAAGGEGNRGGGGGGSFFEPAGMERLDAQQLLRQAGVSSSSSVGGGPGDPVPKPVDLLVHPKLNAATVIFMDSSAARSAGGGSGGGAAMGRHSRRTLLSILQSTRRTTSQGGAQVLMEKMSSMGCSASFLSDHEIQMHMRRDASRGVNKGTLIDYARKSFLYGSGGGGWGGGQCQQQDNQAGGHVDGNGNGNGNWFLKKLPLLAISDPAHPLRDIPVFQPFQRDLHFFSTDSGSYIYPLRADFMDGCNLMGYNLAKGDHHRYLQLAPRGQSGRGERRPRHMTYSWKQHVWLVFFDCLDAGAECSILRNPDAQYPGLEQPITIQGRDGAFVAPNDAQYAILDEDGMKLTVYTLEGAFEDVRPSAATRGRSGGGGGEGGKMLALTWEGAGDGGLSPSAQENGDGDAGGMGMAGVSRAQSPPPPLSAWEPDVALSSSRPSKPQLVLNQTRCDKVPLEFSFDAPVQRVFPCALEDSLLYVCAGSHVGIVSIRAVSWGGGRLGGQGMRRLLSTMDGEHKSLKLKPLERVLQVSWQETSKGHVAGIVSTMRVLIVSASLEVIAETSTPLDVGYPPFRSCLWVGPALLFSSATTIAVLGWDSGVRTVLTIDQPNAGMLGMLNDRVLLATWAESPKSGVEIKSRLIGLLEPLLIGWVTMQSCFDRQLDLSQVMFQITSRFDSLRISPRMLEVLSLGPDPCGDLAVELSYTQAGPQFTQELRCGYAIRARRFDTAFTILKDEFGRSRDYPRCPPCSRLFQRFRELGRACIRYGQFDKAKETFERVGDYESMFDLFLTHMNPSALRRLVQKLEETDADPELKRQCDKLLAMRSTGWGGLQCGAGGVGGAFSALMGGDNMTPKGSEWAGGNWEMKVKPEIKKVQDWQLATEVSGHMKVVGPAGQSQAIPTIIADTLGVYLGTEKGRTQVLEERDAAKFLSRFVDNEGAYENGHNAEDDDSHGSPGAESAPSLFSRHGSEKVDDRPEDAGGVGGSVAKLHPGWSSSGKHVGTGGALLALPAPGGAADEEETEEQKRAAKEFAKGFKGSVSDSSSDEEEDSGTARRKSKFQIRIRDAKGSGTGKDAVNVDKLKEATRQFRVGEINKSVTMSMQFGAGTLKPGKLVFGAPGVGGSQAGSSTAPPRTEGTPENAGATEWENRASMEGTVGHDMVSGGGVDWQQSAMGFMAPVEGVGGYSMAGDPSHQSAPGGDGMMMIRGLGGAMGMGMAGLPQQDSVTMSGVQGGMGVGVVDRGQPGGLLDLSFDGPPSGPTFQAVQLSGGSRMGMQAFAMPTTEFEGAVFGGVSMDGSRSSGPESYGGGLLAFDTPPGSVSKSGGGGDRGSGGRVLSARGTEQGVVGSFGAGGAADGPSNRPGVQPGFVPKGASASQCFKAGLAHLERNALADALSCFNESFVSLSKEFAAGKDIKSQARMCAQYKIAVMLLQEIAKLQTEVGVGGKEEMARMARHLSALPLQPKHRVSCVRTAIKKNMDVHNYGYAKRMLDFLLAKAPPNKQAELKGMINICVQRGLVDRAIDGPEDSSKFCAATLGRLPTIGHDTCDVCSANFTAVALPVCPICGLGTVQRSDALTGVYSSPFA